MGKRQPSPTPETWEQLEMRIHWPEQRSYEVIRPVVLFGDSAADRAHATGQPIRTIYRHLQRFTAKGFAGLTEAANPPPPRTLPPAVRTMILALKAEHPPLTANAIARICWTCLHYRPGARTIARILRETPPTPPAKRRFPVFHALSPTRRRWAIIRLHLDGWGVNAIAAYMQTTRRTVSLLLKRFTSEDLAALRPRSRRPRHRVRKVTVAIIQRIRSLQHNHRLGAWRMAAALKQEGIRISPRTCGLIMAKNKTLYAELRPPDPPPAADPKPMPFAAIRPHQFWSIDIRYLDMHQLGGGNIYCLTILDNYSRAVIASCVSRSQDLTMYLLVLFAAIRNHGAPEAIVTDGGSIFRANQAQNIYRALGITKHQIAKKQPWQNYIETTFNIQRRMADVAFETATTWEALLDAHAVWVANYNYQDHWAHRQRSAAYRSPVEVLRWIPGRPFADADLRFVFYSTRFQRRLNRFGYVQFRSWRIYAEEGLANHAVTLWLYRDHLTISYDDLVVAQYQVRYQPDQHHFTQITDPALYPTPHQSPQMTFWERQAGWWNLAQRLALLPIRRIRQPVGGEQLPIDPSLFEAPQDTAA